MGRKKKALTAGTILKGWMLAARMFGGFSSEPFWIDWATTAGGYEGATRKRPCVAERCSFNPSFFAPGRSACQPMWSPNERDLSIKCVQSAVIETETTRATRSRECAASIQCGGAHARDSSIARGTRPSAPEIRRRIGRCEARLDSDRPPLQISLVQAVKLVTHDRQSALSY